MWVCSGTQSDSKPWSSRALPSSVGWMLRSVANTKAPNLIGRSGYVARARGAAPQPRRPPAPAPTARRPLIRAIIDVQVTAATSSRRREGDEVRDLLRAAAGATLEPGQRVGAVPQRARAARAGRRPRLRPRLGRRAPLPGGVLALARAGGLPRSRQPADEEHPPRPRDRPAHDQPPREGGRTGGGARHPEQRPR